MGTISKNRKLDIVFVSLLSLMLILGTGVWIGYSFTGNTNTFAPGSLETATLNVTGDWYRGSTNLTARLLGTWGALISTTLDTGQGAYELYGMDQNVLTTSSPTFNALTVATLDTGYGANDLFDMDQHVLTTSDPTFDEVTVTTLDTGQGANELYDMDQDVLTSSSPTFDGVTVANLYSEYDYYIRNNTGTIEAYARNGSLMFSDADFGAVWNSALTDMDWMGRVAIEGGFMYRATTQAWVNGTEGFLDECLEIVGVGGGPWPVIAPIGNNIHGFRFSGGPNVYLHKLFIDMPTTGTSGSAIYGTNAGGAAYEENSAFLCRFEDLKLAGCTAGVWVWYMEDIEWAVFSGQIYVNGGWEANGVWFKTTLASQFGYGENHFTGSLYVSVAGEDTICLLLEGSGTGHTMTLFTGSGKFWLRNDGGSPNSTGLWTKNVTSAYIGILHIENVQFHLIANATDFTIFDWGLQTTTINGNDTWVCNLDSACQGNVIMNVHILGAGWNFTAFTDGNIDTNNPNTYQNICLRAFATGNIGATMAGGQFYPDDYGDDGHTVGRWYKKFGGGTYP